MASETTSKAEMKMSTCSDANMTYIVLFIDIVEVATVQWSHNVYIFKRIKKIQE